MIRTGYAVALVAVAVSVVVACSSSDDSGSSGSGTSSAKFKSCPTSAQSSCSQADLDTYDNCVLSACDSQYKTCFGADYRNGNFSGDCGDYIKCQQACACNDTACAQACQGKIAGACQKCVTSFASCAQSCKAPACETTGTASSTSSTGGTGSTGSGSHTCAQLTACVAKIPAGQIHDGCNSVAGTNNDAACSESFPSCASQATGGASACD